VKRLVVAVILVLSGLVALPHAAGLAHPHSAKADSFKPFWVKVEPGTQILSCARPDCPQIAKDPVRPTLLRVIPDVGGKFKVSWIRFTPNCSGANCVWYKVSLGEEQYIPQNVTQEWLDPLPLEHNPCSVPNCVVVDQAQQTVHLMHGGIDIFRTWMSSGLPGYGIDFKEYQIDRKFETKRMVSPFVKRGIKGFYDLSGIPWNMGLPDTLVYLHGVYWHAGFGTPQSHGCVGLTDYDAKFLYDRTNIGTVVLVGNNFG